MQKIYFIYTLFKVPIIRAFLMICCYDIRKSYLFSKWKQVLLPLAIFSNNFVVSATLLVAINEIRRSARAKGLSFYQYGMYHYNSKVCGYLKHNLFTSVCIMIKQFSVFPFPFLFIDLFSILLTNNILQIRRELLI